MSAVACVKRLKFQTETLPISATFTDDTVKSEISTGLQIAPAGDQPLEESLV